MAEPTSYLLCGTPRTGSTLLCSLLSSTGVLGYPDSYFRQEGESSWAASFGLTTHGSILDYPEYTKAVRRASATPNGVSGIRVMWGSLEHLLAGLGQRPGQADRSVLERALGRLTFIHLHRDDVYAQAASWARAEQTGYWQHGDQVRRTPDHDLAQLKDLLRTIRDHNAAWDAWFEANDIAPYRVSYEKVVTDRRRTISGIARHIGVELPPDWVPESPHQRQADELNRAWADQLRHEDP